MILLALHGILLGSYALLTILPRLSNTRKLDAQTRGRISLSLLFLFTGLSHFTRTEDMAQMLPAWVPLRTGLVYVTGVLELAGAIGLLLPGVSRLAGLCLISFLVLVFPANVYAAINQVAMGGHESGPAYLLVRGPFQALLVWWAYWSAVRRPGGFSVTT